MKQLANIPKDKLLHFFYGTIIAFVLLNITPSNYHIEALLVCAGIAAAKELIWDKYLKRGNCELADFIYTFIPAIFIYVSKLVS